MRLCFLMKRRYAPYIKWFGSAFARLDCASDLVPIFTRVLEANSWEERQTHLTTAYEFVAKMHNTLGITKPLKTEVSQYHSRPFLVVHADIFVGAIRAVIKSEKVRVLPEPLGSIDQFIDSTDAERYLDRLKLVY
jgi:hypothetical protein